MTDVTTGLSQAQIDEMRTGARNAVKNCMAVTANDRVFLLSDQVSHPIGRVLKDAAIETGASTELHHLEEYGSRPITSVPESLLVDLRRFKPTVTLYAASSQPGEVAFRMGLRTILTGEFKVRHGHMPGINYRLMVEGMRTDYKTIAALTHRVCELARAATTIHVVTPDGSSLTAAFDPALRWIPSTGMYSMPGSWGNLPDGETFTCPHDVNGRIVVHLLGDYFSAKYGVLKSPLTLDIEGARVKSVTGPTPDAQAIADELVNYLDSSPNGRRVGEFAIGTNIGLKGLTGNLLQDEKLPGIHIAFGNPYPEETGADWSAKVHVDVIATHCTITIDDRILMRDGHFDYSLLNFPAA